MHSGQRVTSANIWMANLADTVELTWSVEWYAVHDNRLKSKKGIQEKAIVQLFNHDKWWSGEV